MKGLILGLVLFTLCLRAHGNHPPSRINAMLSFPKAEVLSEHTVRIPFAMADHLILLQAEVLGKQGNLILDTGASHLVLNNVHFQPPSKSDGSLSGNSMSGRLDEVFTDYVEKIAFTSFHIPQKLAHFHNLSHLESQKKTKILGIIGQDVLQDFEVFIDFYLKQITLSRTDRKGNTIDKHLKLEKIQDSLSFTLSGHSIVLHTRVNGVPLKMGLDTGAEINFLDLRVPKKVLEKFRVIQRVKMTGIQSSKKEVLAGKLYNLTLENNEVQGVMRTLLGDLSDMHLTYGTVLDGVLGYEFIAMKRLIINYHKEMIFFVSQPFSQNP